MKSKMNQIIPVFPSQDIERDVNWYIKYAGFNCTFQGEMYAVLRRGAVGIHLQWHADTDEDPLLGGSVARIDVDNIYPIFQEFVEMKTVTEEQLKLKTAWNTNEFGFYDLNNNAIFITQALS